MAEEGVADPDHSIITGAINIMAAVMGRRVLGGLIPPWGSIGCMPGRP